MANILQNATISTISTLTFGDQYSISRSVYVFPSPSTLHLRAMQKGNHVEMNKRVVVVKAKAKSDEIVDISLSHRVIAVRPSKTVAISDHATALSQAGEPDFDTPPVIAESGMNAIREGYTRYTPNAGTFELRQAICHKLKEENGIRYTPDEIVVSNGAKQSIVQALLAVCSC